MELDSHRTRTTKTITSAIVRVPELSATADDVSISIVVVVDGVDAVDGL